MMLQSNMRVVFVICGIIVTIIVGLFFWGWIASHRVLKEIKPWVTYTRLMGVASDCDKYGEKYGAWPTDLTQLIRFRPELTSWAKDGWGRYVVLIPFNKKLGYGEIVSYGRDGKPGGTGADSDMMVKFPTEANAAWNKQQGAGLKKPQRAP